MAYSDIQQHFKGLRVQTARRSRRNPFATGFEDDSDDDTNNPRRSRSKTRAAAAPPSVVATSDLAAKPAVRRRDLPSPAPPTETLRDSEDEFLDPPKRTNRQPSPAPRSRTRAAVALAAGPLAFLDDSSDDQEFETSYAHRRDRRPSPAPHHSSDSLGPRDASSPHVPLPPRHTVASPFAGTKYLEDSDSDSDDVAVSSRQGSTDSNISQQRTSLEEDRKRSGSTDSTSEVIRTDKPKHPGSGVSWRAFSAGRAEQRSAEIEALQSSLKKRGRSISFASYAATDDGERVPVAVSEKRCSTRRPRPNVRNKSPPRRNEDRRPSEDEVGDGPFILVVDQAAAGDTATSPSGTPLQQIDTATSSATILAETSLISELTKSRIREDESLSTTSPSDSGMTDSADSILSRLTISPRAIPEGRVVDYASSPIVSPGGDPFGEWSRNSSMRSLRMSSSRPTRIPNSRRSSRRSTSAHASASPAHAFLASWANSSEQPPEPKPDDEGQPFGLNNEYIIGRTVGHGGFAIVKEAHTIYPSGQGLVRAVKIVRKHVPGKSDLENERIQQELEHEVSIWRYLKHPHILDLHAVYETEYATFCVMELNLGGTLFDLVRIARARSAENDGRKHLEPRTAKKYAYHLALALRYLHEDMRICHRDVKLENCLVDMSAADAGREGGLLRLCDFGLSDFLNSDQSLDDETSDDPDASALTGGCIPTTSSIIGTLEYASPKGLCANRKLFETAGDVWAYGVVVYAVCTGELPFRHDMPAKNAELILQAEWDTDALLLSSAGGDAAMEMVKACFEKESDLRVTIGEVLDSTWFDGFLDAGHEHSERRW